MVTDIRESETKRHKSRGRKGIGGGREDSSPNDFFIIEYILQQYKPACELCEVNTKGIWETAKVFIFIECSSERGCWRGRKMWIMLPELLCGQGPVFCASSARCGALCSSPWQLSHLLRGCCSSSWSSCWQELAQLPLIGISKEISQVWNYLKKWKI